MRKKVPRNELAVTAFVKLKRKIHEGQKVPKCLWVVVEFSDDETDLKNGEVCDVCPEKAHVILC